MPKDVLILDFDFFTAVGGGQTFYRRVVERNPDILFHYPSRGADVGSGVRLPANARPFRIDTAVDLDRDIQACMPGCSMIDRRFAGEVARVLAAVQGRAFDVVDVPSFFPGAHHIRPLAIGFGILVRTVSLGLLGWSSVSARHAYAGEISDQKVSELEQAESESIAAVDVLYVISGTEIAQTHTPVSDAILIDMHDTFETVPLPSESAPADRAPDIWYVGRLDRAKAPDLFIELAARMRGLYRSCRFTGPDNEWSGATRWSTRLVEMAAKHGVTAHYEGLLSDADLRERVYRGATILVIPSRTDAFNYVALEAIQSGCVVLLSRRAGAFEFLSRHYPDLVPATMDPDDLDSAAQALRSQLDDYPAVARQSRARIRAHPIRAPRFGFMADVYCAKADQPSRIEPRNVEKAARFRDRKPLMRGQVRTFRPVRAATDAPLASIIVPTLDRPAMLTATLATLSRQSIAAIEIIVVDDGSRERKQIQKIVASFGTSVRSIHARNGGEAVAVNRGLREAQGQFVGILSDDDAYWPELLELSIASLDANPDAIGTYPDWAIADEAGVITEAHRLPEFDRNLMLTAHWCLPGPGAIARRSVLQAVQGRDPSFRFVSDFDLWLRTTALGPMIHIPRELGLWRLHRRNATHSPARQAMAYERVQLLRKLYRDEAEQRRSCAIRHTAFAAAHLAAAAILGRRDPSAMVHLAHAAALDPELPENLPTNMSRYPQSWPSEAADAFKIGRQADSALRRKLAFAARQRTPPTLADLRGRRARLYYSFLSAAVRTFGSSLASSAVLRLKGQ